MHAKLLTIPLDLLHNPVSLPPNNDATIVGPQTPCSLD